MKADAGRPHADPLVTAAEIARLAGVTRAAVSNWRRRYADFPAPATDSTSSPLFDLAEVRAWLDAQRKGQEMSAEVRLWQQLRTDHGDDMIGGLTAVARLLARREEPGDAALRPLVDELAADRSPAELLAGLTARFAESSGRAGSDGITSPHLVRAVRHFAGPDVPGRTVYDPACGTGSLLFAFRPGARSLAGQELDPARARYAELRAEVTGPAGVTVRAGDSLRADALPELRADLVVCEPPAGAADWGREELLLDPRWEFGVPSRAESELAWLQHCYRHTAPGGRVVVVMPASVAYRKAGRRIRAEIVRRGMLTEVVALPPGMAATHALPVHLWLLRRPAGPEDTADHVRMTDLSANAPDGPFEAADDQTAPVARIDLLDDTVDLSPAAYISARHTDFTAQYAATRAEIKERLERLLDTLLPPLLEGTAESFQERATVGLAELARAGLVETTEGAVVSTSDQLDTDYINGFLRGAANNRRSTSASGTFRLDTRGARIPQMAVEEQRRYGSAFRALTEFEQAVAQLARLSERTTTLARTGLTTGTLRPPAP
ncbi:N-6 DNA methylase [Streptomyces sp. AC1-42W]|uniref:N-6 DNA methylase n=2 Tax=unclassified Streptomyces TaxID=2593676 RepID=UPI000DAC4A78|nr:N-6 DNA methylase [Streptomyces sp. AC1-42W]PZT78149.1 SAM-dependent methyltransferase [Streptomyces sp. AC1-42W]